MSDESRLFDSAAVLIGRNEGARLIASLDSLQGLFARIIYVDSGSTDDSQQQAKIRGADVVELDTDQPFTAARARNAGLEHLMTSGEAPEFVQFIDGDCALHPDWPTTARAFLQATPKAAVTCGRRRERFPEATPYNAMIDAEWDTPTGQTKACGGDAMMRISALQDVSAFNPTLIAGEEPELCVRLRANGWTIWRLDREMTLHDADITKFSQWWQRTRRAGFAYAQGVAMHGRAPERHNVRKLQRALAWGLALPLAIILLAVFVTPWALLGCVLWPAQVARLHFKGTPTRDAFFLTVGKFPEAQGAMTYAWRTLRGANYRLIEYK